VSEQVLQPEHVVRPERAADLLYHVEKGNAVLRPLARLERLDHQERHHGSLAQPA
jgi:hypothetical protein